VASRSAASGPVKERALAQETVFSLMPVYLHHLSGRCNQVMVISSAHRHGAPHIMKRAALRSRRLCRCSRLCGKNHSGSAKFLHGRKCAGHRVERIFAALVLDHVPLGPTLGLTKLKNVGPIHFIFAHDRIWAASVGFHVN